MGNGKKEFTVYTVWWFTIQRETNYLNRHSVNWKTKQLRSKLFFVWAGHITYVRLRDLHIKISFKNCTRKFPEYLQSPALEPSSVDIPLGLYWIDWGIMFHKLISQFVINFLCSRYCYHSCPWVWEFLLFHLLVCILLFSCSYSPPFSPLCTFSCLSDCPWNLLVQPIYIVLTSIVVNTLLCSILCSDAKLIFSSFSLVGRHFFWAFIIAYTILSFVVLMAFVRGLSWRGLLRCSLNFRSPLGLSKSSLAFVLSFCVVRSWCLIQ